MPQIQSKLFHSAVSPAEAQKFLALKLSLEADAGDIQEALKAGEKGLVVIDARNAEAFAKGHIAGAIHLSADQVNASSTASFDKAAVYVTYCGGPACNASTRVAEKLAGLGFNVKEFAGGLPKWQEKGFSVAQGSN